MLRKLLYWTIDIAMVHVSVGFWIQFDYFHRNDYEMKAVNFFLEWSLLHMYCFEFTDGKIPVCYCRSFGLEFHQLWRFVCIYTISMYNHDWVENLRYFLIDISINASLLAVLVLFKCDYAFRTRTNRWSRFVRRNFEGRVSTCTFWQLSQILNRKGGVFKCLQSDPNRTILYTSFKRHVTCAKCTHVFSIWRHSREFEIERRLKLAFQDSLVQRGLF